VWRPVQVEDFDLLNYRILSLNSTNEDGHLPFGGRDYVQNKGKKNPDSIRLILVGKDKSKIVEQSLNRTQGSTASNSNGVANAG